MAGQDQQQLSPMAMYLSRGAGQEFQGSSPEYHKSVLLSDRHVGGLKLLHLVIDHQKMLGQLISSTTTTAPVAASIVRSTAEGSGSSSSRVANPRLSSSGSVRQLPEEEEEEHVCTICGDTFVQKTAFNSHIKVHLKEKLCRRAQLLAQSPSGDASRSSIPVSMTPQKLVHKTTSIGSRQATDYLGQESLLPLSTSPSPAHPHLNMEPQQQLAAPKLMKTEQEDFVKTEFSQEMEINREDLNSDLCSILDQIEKDFEGPGIHMRDVQLDGPASAPTDDQTPGGGLSNYLATIVSHGTTGLVAPETLLPEADQSLSTGAANNNCTAEGYSLHKMSLDRHLGNGISLNAGREFNQTAADHDYLLELPDTSSRVHVSSAVSNASEGQPIEGGRLTASLSTPALSKSQPSQSLLKLSNMISVPSDSPGRIFIRRSTTDPRILNVYRLSQEVSKVEPPAEPREESERRDSRTSTDSELEPFEAEGGSGDSGGEKSSWPSSAKIKQSAECHVCGKSITTKNMARHMEKHTGKKKFQCEQCQTSFYQKTHLKNHILLHETGEYHECGECQQKFLRRADFLKHQKAVHLVEVSTSGPYSYSQCGARFVEPRKLELHKQAHTASLLSGGERRELCGLCGKKFACRATMMAHMAQHTMEVTSSVGESDITSKSIGKCRPFTCSVCRKSFSQRSHLNRHIKSHGGGDIELVCLACGKQCRNRVELVRHRAAHIACSICRTLVGSRAQLQKHLLREHPSRTIGSAAPSSRPCFMSPGSLSSLDMDLLEEEEDEVELGDGDQAMRPLSPMDMFSSSPCPSAASSSSSLTENWREKADSAGFPSFFSKFESDDWMAEGESEGRMGTLSLDDIADSSFFDINRHLDAEILSTDLFPS